MHLRLAPPPALTEVQNAMFQNALMPSITARRLSVAKEVTEGRSNPPILMPGSLRGTPT